MNIYGKPILFAILAVVVVSIGTLVSTFLPMLWPEMMLPMHAGSLPGQSRN